MTTTDRAPAATVPALARGPVLAVAGVVGVLLTAYSGRYGYFGDELYFVVAGHHPAWGRTGALAVTGTGVATLYLVAAAATALYGYVPVPVGLVLALLVAAGGLGLADRWRAPLLARGAVLGAALLAPVVNGRVSPLVVALVLVLQIAATVVALRRSWSGVLGLAAVWPVLYGTVVAVAPFRPWTVATSAAAVLVLGLVGAGWVPRGGATRPAGSLPRGLRGRLVVAAPVPALTVAADAGSWPGAPLAYLAAGLLFTLAARLGRDDVVGVVALAAGTLAMAEGTAVAFDGGVETAVLLGEGVIILVLAAVLRSRATLAAGAALAGLGTLLTVAVQVPLDALVSYPAPPFAFGPTPEPRALLVAGSLSALMVTAALAALVASAEVGLLGSDGRAARLWAPAGLVGLYGAAGLVIASALLVSPSHSGFVAGHAVVTVSWTVVALFLLARGIRRPALRVAGLVLVAAAVGKLVLFDLVTLDGLARVAAFLGAGLLLLAAGARYARLVAEAEPTAAVPAEAAPQPRT